MRMSNEPLLPTVAVTFGALMISPVRQGAGPARAATSESAATARSGREACGRRIEVRENIQESFGFERWVEAGHVSSPASGGGGRATAQTSGGSLVLTSRRTAL